MSILAQLRQDISETVSAVYKTEMESSQIALSHTIKEYGGDYTYVVFPLVKSLRQSPPVIAEAIGTHLAESSKYVKSFNVVKGFLNIEVSDLFWSQVLSDSNNSDYGIQPSNGKKMMVEFSSPNTNKPLHLGHIRNILLGWSTAQLAKANGYEVVKTQIINDRGIAVCKSMMAWTLMGEGKTPESEGIKGDHFVGEYYVKFDKAFQEEYLNWQSTEEGVSVYNTSQKENEVQEHFFKRFKNNYFNQYSKLGIASKEMLLKWEAGDPEIKALWEKMNGWVYSGFNTTYDALGVDFDSTNYESDTYLLGKEFVEEGITRKVFYKEPDNSVWADLEDAGMDKKIVLRSDGTSVYMTQDIGTAHQRYADHKMDNLVYVVGDEQDYHFKVLFEILKRLDEPYAANLFHLSYGMVDLPTGRMKSREGTVVDADILIKEIIDEARKSAEARGGLEGVADKEKEEIYRKIGLAALKFFIIKVTAKKRMTFDPKESVDMQGQTGPYVQNAYVRIRSILRRLDEDMQAQLTDYNLADYKGDFHESERDILLQLETFPVIISDSLKKYDPSLMANFCYSLAKAYHRFYHDCRILNLEDQDLKKMRLILSKSVADVLSRSMKMIGIEMPEYM